MFATSRKTKLGHSSKKQRNVHVEMTVDPSTSCIAFLGFTDDVQYMKDEIQKEISQAQKLEKERQEEENARMISKTVEWSYDLSGQKTPFDLEANLKIEKAYTNDDLSVEVSSNGEDFAINLCNEPFTAHVQLQSESVAVTRGLKGVEGELNFTMCG